MAIYDRELRRLVLRIVYDGPPGAGKTTNLQTAKGFFTERRRSELASPGVGEDGRTVYFDWMDLDAGLVAGHQVRCQLLTVPGQAERASRRWILLHSADAVVFVCRGTEEGVREARPYLDVLREHRRVDRAEETGLVVQANQLDREDALSVEAIAEGLGVTGAGIQVVGAEALNGMGVREALVLAIRSAANLAQKALIAEGLEAISAPAQTAEELLEGMLGDESDEVPALGSPAFESAFEATVAPVAAAETAPLEAAAERDTRDVAAAETAPLEAGTRDVEASPERDEDPVSASHVDRASLEPEAVEEPEASATRAREASERPTDRPPRRRYTSIPPYSRPPTSRPPPEDVETPRPPTSPPDAPRARAESKTLRPPPAPAELAIPPLPHADIPSRYIWPAWQGREILRTIPAAHARRRDDLVGRHTLADGSGRSDVVILEAGEWCLKTSARRCYVDGDAARDALLHLARRKVQLGSLLPPRTVLVLREVDASELWMWTVSPWLRTLRSTMQAATVAHDEDALARALLRYADVAFESLRLAHDQQLVLDVHPSNFGSDDEGGVYYVDDDIAHGPTNPAFGYAILQRIEEYASHGDAVERFVTRVEERLAATLARHPAKRGELRACFSETVVRSEASRTLRRRLLEGLDGS